jgi:molecular chaperone DnaK
VEKEIAIDLGTYLSEVSHVNDAGIVEVIPNLDGDSKTPSIVSVANSRHLVGRGATPDIIMASECVIKYSKRYMCKVTESGKPIPILTGPDNKEITAVDAAADILAYLKESAEKYLGSKVTKVVVTHPAYFNPIGRENTKAAAKIAGFTDVRILDEPEAAAIYYSLEKNRDETVAVVDFGGGTLDVTVMEIKGWTMKVLITDGDTELGGVNYDEAILAYMVEEAKEDGISISADNLTEFYQALDRAREAKEMLSRRDEVVIVAEANGKRKTVTLTREIFRKIARPIDERYKQCCQRVADQLKSTGKKIDRVLMVGGSSRLFHVPGIAREVFGIEPSCDADPDLSIVKGAAIWAVKCFGDGSETIFAGGRSHLVKAINMQTVLSHAICVAAIRNFGSSDMNEYNCCVVPANTPLPYEFRERFSPADPHSSSVVVKFVSGQPEQLSKDCPLLHEVKVPIRPSDKHADRIIVEGKITDEGVVNITVKDELLDKTITDSFVHAAGLTKAEIDQKRRQFEQDKGV